MGNSMERRNLVGQERRIFASCVSKMKSDAPVFQKYKNRQIPVSKQ